MTKTASARKKTVATVPERTAEEQALVDRWRNHEIAPKFKSADGNMVLHTALFKGAGVELIKAGQRSVSQGH